MKLAHLIKRLPHMQRVVVMCVVSGKLTPIYEGIVDKVPSVLFKREVLTFSSTLQPPNSLISVISITVEKEKESVASLQDLWQVIEDRIDAIRDMECSKCEGCKLNIAGECEFDFLRFVLEHLEDILKDIESITVG